MSTPPSGALRVLLVDDEPLSLARMRTVLETAPPGTFEIVGEVDSGSDAIVAIMTLSPDVVLLDIHMPGIDGFEVVRAVGPDRMPETIFVTAYDQYALAAFEAQALAYLLKPYSDERLLAALERARRMVGGDTRASQLSAVTEQMTGKQAYVETLSVRRGEAYELVREENIVWMESADNYVRIHLEVEPRTQMVRGSISELEARMNPAFWVRVHRSAMVRRDRVRKVSPMGKGAFELQMSTGVRIMTARSYADAVRSLMGIGGIAQ